MHRTSVVAWQLDDEARAAARTAQEHDAAGVADQVAQHEHERLAVNMLWVSSRARRREPASQMCPKLFLSMGLRLALT